MNPPGAQSPKILTPRGLQILLKDTMDDVHGGTPMKSRLRLLCLAAACAAGTGCGEEPETETGAATLTWQVSPRGCFEAGVEQVEVTLFGAEMRSDRFACADGEGSFEDLPTGIYSVEVRGLDATGNHVFEAARHTIALNGQRTVDAGHFRLTAKPASVRSTWRFEDGLVCGAHHVDTIEIGVYDKNDYEVARERFSCNAGSGAIDGLVAGTYVVEALGYVLDRPTHYGIAHVSLDRGENAESQITLVER